MQGNQLSPRVSIFLQKISKVFPARSNLRIYIIPTWYCFLFNIMLIFSMVVGFSANNVSVLLAGFLILFIELLSMIESHVNLRELSIDDLKVSPCVELSETSLTIKVTSQSESFGVGFYCVDNSDSHSRRSIISLLSRKIGAYGIKEVQKALFGFKRSRAEDQETETRLSISNDPQTLSLPFKAMPRGVHRVPHVVAVSMFPFGLFRVWREFRWDSIYPAYPLPRGRAFYSKAGRGLNARLDDTSNAARGGSNDMDFSQHRQYQSGDNLRRIDWRVSSRLSARYVREFSDDSGDEARILRWSDTGRADADVRLSQLCFWVFEAHGDGVSYALELPNVQTQLGFGGRHLHHCLGILADYDLEKMAPGGQL